MSTRDVIKVEVTKNNNFEYMRYASYLGPQGQTSSRYITDDGDEMVLNNNLTPKQIAVRLLNK